MLISNFSKGELLKSVNLGTVFLDLLLKTKRHSLRDFCNLQQNNYHICACPKHLLSTSEKLL